MYNYAPKIYRHADLKTLPVEMEKKIFLIFIAPALAWAT